ncbi:hypothetical protein J6590_021014 [Homalodisca vitripennis]|nr:hypothetical protein J6590_021014 [Homalodisca vitripennis]
MSGYTFHRRAITTTFDYQLEGSSLQRAHSITDLGNVFTDGLIFEERVDYNTKWVLKVQQGIPYRDVDFEALNAELGLPDLLVRRSVTDVFFLYKT